MASIQFFTRTKDQDFSSLYVRFGNGRLYQCECRTGMFVNSKEWDKKKQQLVSKRLKPDTVAQFNLTILKLKTHITEQFHESYREGTPIDTPWLKKVLANYFGNEALAESKKIPKRKVFVGAYVKDWIDNKIDTYVSDKTNSHLRDNSKANYRSFYQKVLAGYIKEKGDIRFSTLTKEKAEEIRAYWYYDQAYDVDSVNNSLRFLTFFVNRARDEGISVPSNFKTVSLKNKDKPIKPYLNFKELDILRALDLSHDKKLDRARDLFLLEAWTCLRYSDVSELDSIEIQENDLVFNLTTLKTRTPVSIPIFETTKEIIKKYDGFPPGFSSNDEFNNLIREVCKIAGFHKIMRGDIKKETSKGYRIVRGDYHKYELISSHTGRRSFATNMLEHLGITTVMRIGGWQTQANFFRYIKKSNDAFALEALDKFKAQLN